MEKIHEDIEYAKTIQSDFYNSTQQFNKAKEQIFVKSWQILSDDRQLKLSNSAVPIHYIDGFIDEPLLLINNEGSIDCFSNVCTQEAIYL